MQKVGHVTRVEHAFARVADGLNTLMVGEVERQNVTYKPHAHQLLGRGMVFISRILQMAGLALAEPKRRARSSQERWPQRRAARAWSERRGWRASSSQRPAAAPRTRRRR